MSVVVSGAIAVAIAIVQARPGRRALALVVSNEKGTLEAAILEVLRQNLASSTEVIPKGTAKKISIAQVDFTLDNRSNRAIRIDRIECTIDRHHTAEILRKEHIDRCEYRTDDGQDYSDAYLSILEKLAQSEETASNPILLNPAEKRSFHLLFKIEPRIDSDRAILWISVVDFEKRRYKFSQNVLQR